MASIQEWLQKGQPTLGDSMEDPGTAMQPLPSAPESDFQKWATGAASDQKLDGVMRTARKENPELRAEVFKLQGKTGLPAELIQRNLDMVREKVDEQSFDAVSFRKEFPKLAGAMEDPDTASIAHDDLDSLQIMERVLSGDPRQDGTGGGVIDPGALRRQLLNGDISPEEYQDLMPKLKTSLVGDIAVAAQDRAADGARQNAAWQAFDRSQANERFQSMGTLEWFTEAPVAAWKQGRLGEERNTLAFEQMMRGGDASLEGRLTEIEGQLGRSFGDESLLGGMLVSSAEFAPSTVSSLVAGAKTGVATGIAAGTGAAIVGQLGPQVAVPEEILTVPGATMLGFAAGSRTGAAEYSMRQETGGAYREFRAFRDEDGNPLDNSTATVAAVVAGSVNAGLELFGLETLVKSFPGGDKLMGKISRDSVKAALQQPTVRKAFADLGKRFGGVWTVETMTEVAQEGVVILGGELAKAFSAGDFEGATAEEVQERMTETLKMAAQGMVLMSAPGPITNFAKDYGRARGAQQTRDTMEALGEGARASKLRERMPEKYRQIVDKLRQDGPLENVQVPVERWNELFQMQGIDPAEMANEVLGSYDQYSEALAAGGDLVIPMSAYAEKLAASQFHEALSDNARFNPGDMTPREAREWMELAPETAQSFVDDMANPPADPSQAVFDDVLGQLTAAGRDRTAAENEARLTQSVFRTLGERMGVDPAELFQQYGVTISRPMPEILRQATKGIDTELDPLIDRLRTGDLPSQQDAFGKSLVEFLREKGIRDEGGELAARDANVGRKAFQRALAREDGITLDDAAQAAAEANYITGRDRSTVTQQDLLDAIDRELSGEAVYASDQGDAQAQNLLDTLNALGDYLDEMGADLEAMDNQMIKALLNGEVVPEQEQAGDATTLNQDGEGPRLSAIHKISADGLLFADSVGGLAVPSIGVVTEDAGGVEGFGDITLIGGRSLADPSQEAVFSADAYTARFPKPVYKGYSRKTRDEVYSLFEEFDAKYGGSDLDQMLGSYGQREPDAGELISRAMTKNAVIGAYLAEQGIDVTPVMKGSGVGDLAGPVSMLSAKGWSEESISAAVVDEVMGDGIDESLRLAQDYREAYIATKLQEALQAIPDIDPDKVVARNGKIFDGQFLRDNGVLDYPRSTELMEAMKSSEKSAKQEIDTFATREALMSEVADEAEFKRWVESKLLPGLGEPMVEIGKRKVPFTIENIVEAMTRSKSVASQEETMTYGIGQVRAANAERFSDLERMRTVAEKSIRNPDEYAEAAEQSQKLAEQFRDKVGGFTTAVNYRGAPDVFEGFDGAMRAIARYAGYKKGGRAAFERALKAEGFDVAAIKQASTTEETAKPDAEVVAMIEKDIATWERRLGRLTEGDPRIPKVTDKIAKLKIDLEKASTETAPVDLIALGMEAAEAIEKAPVPYFEAKPQRAVSLDEFSGAVIKDTAPDSVRAVLDKHGIPYVEAAEDGMDQAVIDFRNELAGQGRDVLFQGEGQQPRGRISFPQSRKFFNIELLERANLSTFIHESGHLYLEIMRDIAERDGAPQQIRDDFAKILEWFGVESGEAIGVEQHEQWARGFEAYVMEGKSPSSALREAFARFRAWMVAIYRTVAGLNVELTDEVRGVMDRLVATDEEITEAGMEAGYQPLFNDAAAAGMTQAEYDAYTNAARRARESSEDALARKVMSEYQRETQRWWKDAKAEMTEEVSAEVNQQPVYVALSVLGRGKLPDGSPLPDGIEPFKLSKSALVDMYGASYLKRLPRPYVYSREGGVHPDYAAEVFGYSSGDELVQNMVNARPRRELIAAEVDQRMLDRYGDMMNDGSMADAAMDAVHNDMRSNVMQAELRALGRRSGRQPSPTQIIKDAAQRIVSEKKVRDIKPHLYLRAEQKAAREAFRAAADGDFNTATDAKQRQLLNHHLYREATRATDDAAKIQAYMARFNKKATRTRLAKAGGEYLPQIDNLLTRYEFKKTSLKRIDGRRSLEAWIDQQNADGFTIDVPEAVADDARIVNWREVSIEELRGMRDAVKQIEHLARTKNKLLAAADQRSFEEQIDSVVSTIEANHTRVERSVPMHESFTAKLGQWAGDVHAWHTKPEFLFRWLDGDAEVGPVWQALFKPIADAEAAEQRMQEKATKELSRILSAYTREERAKWYGEKRYVQQVGQSIDKSRMISIALNWGNQYNRDVLKEGYGWSDTQVEAILSYLDARDWTVVQELWDFIDSFWPDIKKMEEDLNGIAPEKVAPAGLETPAGTLRGGYYPIKYDTRTSHRANQREERAGASMFENSYTKPATRNGHTKERQGSGGQKLRLDIDVLSQHLGQVMHDLTHRRAIIDVNRLVENSDVRSAIEETAGTELYRQIRPWLQSIANEVNQPESYWEKLIGQARVGATVVNMGLKITTAIVQPLGYLNSVDMLGEKYAWKGLTDFMGAKGLSGKGGHTAWGNMKAGVAFVQARSTMMQNRQKTFDRDVRDSLMRLTKETKLQEAQRSFFYLTGLMDMGVSVPTWLGAYRKAMEGEVAEIEMGDEYKAIDYADSIVRQTQSAGGVKDLAQIQRGGQVRRSFVMFYSYFSVLYNQFARQISRAKRGDASIAQLAASSFYLWFFPSVMGELIAGRGPDDDEEWAEWAARQGILYPMGAVVGLRDVGSAVLTPFGYGASPAFDAFEMTARTAAIPIKALDEDQELGRSDVKAAVLTAGYWGKLPSRQAWITGEYMYDVATGEDSPESPQEFVRNLFFARPADERN